MKTWRLLPVAGALLALAACEGAAPTSPALRPSGSAEALLNCGYLGSGICAARSAVESDSLTAVDATPTERTRR